MCNGWCNGASCKWSGKLNLACKVKVATTIMSCTAILTNKGLECSGTDGGLNDVGHLETGLWCSMDLVATIGKWKLQKYALADDWLQWIASVATYLGGESASGEGEWGHGAEDGKEWEDSWHEHFEKLSVLSKWFMSIHLDWMFCKITFLLVLYTNWYAFHFQKTDVHIRFFF